MISSEISPVVITDKAKEYLKSVSNGDYVTLGVKGGGCSGFQYVWDFKKNWPDVVWSDPIDDVLVLDPLAEMYVLGSEIDYVTELGGSFLAVKNPTASSSCGCGESFGV
jgi:iron-sulfur cluster insertion protein